MAPKISVLMANLNNGRFIERAIDSVQDQTLTDWELVVVDDGSTDNSVGIIQALTSQDLRMKAILRPDTRGVGYTKRQAAANATGAILTMLDPDDALHSRALERHVDAHTFNADVVLAWSDYYVCDPDLTVMSKSDSTFQGDEFAGYLSHKPGTIHSLWSCKASAYRQTAGFSSDYRLAEDQDLFYKLEEIGRTLYVPDALYYYRHHSTGISTGEKTAEAFGWHLLAMKDALQRRRQKSNNRAARELEAVRSHWRSFSEWGLTAISDSLFRRLTKETSRGQMGARIWWIYSREELRRGFRRARPR